VAERAGDQAERIRRLEQLFDASRLLVGELDMEAVLRQVLETAVALTGARYAALGVLNADRSELERFITVGIDDETRERIGDLPRGRGVLGELIRDPRPLRLAQVSSHPRSYGFPHGHPPMSSFLGVPIVIRDEPWGNLYLTEAAAGEFSEEDERDVCLLADWAAIAIANARAYTSVQGRRDELEQAVERLEATTEIARALAGETDLARVLELIVKRARALTDARGAVVMLFRGAELELAAAAGDIGEAAVGDRFPTEQTVGGHVLATGAPERLADASSRLQFALGQATRARTGLFVPMVFGGQPVGVLEVFDRLAGGAEFTASDERLLEAFAGSAAAAVATAQVYASESLRRIVDAQEAERTRWARELHDDTLQELAAMKLLLAAAQREGRRQADRDDLLTRATETVDRLVAGLRHLITDLRPAQLDELGLAAGLEALAERARVLADLRVDVAVDLGYESGRRTERLPEPVETAVYRLAQEALNNVVKHARASRALLQVREADHAIELLVRDDGIGFVPTEVQDGFGLLGMRERVALLGGSLSVTGVPGEGSAVSATIPLEAPTQALAASG
jgi:signal transduction histidine kinase